MTQELDESLITVAKGASIVFIGMIIGNILGIINQILLGRFLGVVNYGLFSISYSLVTLASILAVFGLMPALPRFIPYHLEKNERDVVKSSIRFSALFVLFTSIVIGIIVFYFSDRIATEIFHDARLGILLKIFFIGLPLLSLNNIFQATFQGFKAVKYQVILNDITLRLIKITIFIIFIIVGYVLYGAIASLLIATFIITIISYVLFQKKIFSDSNQIKKVPIAKSLLSFAWPLSLTGLTFLFITKTDVILLGYYHSPSEVGIYTPALVIALFLSVIGFSFGYIFLPVVSGLFAKRKHQEIKSLFKSSSKWMFLLVFPLLLFILLYPREIITQLYGPEYATGYFALSILAFGISSNMLTGMTGSILIAGGKPTYNLTCEIIAAVTNLSLNLALIPAYGISGAAIGTCTSFFARNVASLFFVYKSQKIHPYNYKYLRIIACGVVVFLIFYYIKKEIYLNITSLLPLSIMGICLLFVYFLMIIFSRALDRNDFFILNIIYKRSGVKIRFIEKLFKFNS